MTDQSSLIRTDSPLARERHVVQFYESEDALCAAAAKSVARRARMGQAILLLASGAHRAMIVEELRANGIDPNRCEFVDARELLAACTAGGSLDEDRLRQDLYRIVTAAVKSAESVTVYGELVDMLIAGAHGAAALRLEDLWNELIQVHPISLLCSHALAHFHGAGGGSLLDEVCRRHDGVNPVA